MKYKFPRSLRLTTEEQFKKVFKERKKTTNEILTFYYCYNDFAHPRLGVIIPKKNIKNSSKRNYFKRTIREGFRQNQHNLQNIDIVIFVNNKAVNLKKREWNMFLSKNIFSAAILAL